MERLAADNHTSLDEIYLHKITLEIAAILECTPNKVGVWAFIPCMEAYTRKIKNRGDPIRLDHVTSKILGSFQV